MVRLVDVTEALILHADRRDQTVVEHGMVLEHGPPIPAAIARGCGAASAATAATQPSA